MEQLPKSDRAALLRYIGQPKTARLTDREIIRRAARVSPAEEKDYEIRGTHHTVYKLPAVTSDTMKLLYSEIAEKQSDKMGYIQAEFHTPDPTETTWRSTRIRLASRSYESLEDYDTDILLHYDNYDEIVTDGVLGYAFVFIGR